MEAVPPDAFSESAPPARPRGVTPGRVRAAFDEFVLNDGVTARVRIERADRSMLVIFLDARDDPLPGSPVELTEDLSETIGQTSIVGHWAPAHRLPIAENAEHDGLLRVFVVYGPSSVRFYQYARNEVSLDLRSAGRGVLTEGTRWRLDSGSPYRGSFTSTELEATGMLDGPGTAAGFDPFEAVRRMANPSDADGPDELPADAVFTLAHEFETLPYGDGELLGSIIWGYTLTWRLADGASAGPVPTPVTPLWRPKAEAPPEMHPALGTRWSTRSNLSSPPAPSNGAQWNPRAGSTPG